MKKVVCVVDNLIFLRYGKTYEVVSEFDGEYKLSRDHYESDIVFFLNSNKVRPPGIYWWDKKLFVSLEEFRKEQIEKILE